VELAPGDPQPQSLSLVAGLALIETADVAFPGLSLTLKWPNDLVLGTAKVAGILLERSGDRVVVGFGVNLAHSPDIPGRSTAAFNAAMLPQAFAPLLAGNFARMLTLWRGSEPEAFARAWLARAHPVGTHLTVHGGTKEKVFGTFDGIEADGALRLRRDGDVEVIRAGDVEL
jgi:BirA family biotin operon repressor/biotin-[acetyl-CoA-carboxylase] ligase